MDASPHELRIFPLGEVVLFPDTLLPLHIFEPRYRTMLDDAMADDGRIGMVLTRTAAPEGGQVHEEDCGMYTVGCAGNVVQHRRFDDGRSLIVLRGSLRFRIREELSTDRPYRVASVQPLHEGPPPSEELGAWRQALEASMLRLVAATGGKVEDVEGLFSKLDPPIMVNYLCASLPVDAVEKQAMLECATPGDRYHKLLEVLEFRIAEARMGGAGAGEN